MFAQAWALQQPTEEGVFVCPLCMSKFGRDSLATEALRMEHIIPEAIGGKLKTLTCKACNSRGGSHLDAELVKAIKLQDVRSGRLQFWRRVKIVTKGGHRVSANALDHHEETHSLQIRFVDKASDMQAIDQAVRDLRSPVPEFELSEEELRFDPTRASVAIIRAAYLLMFHFHGYDYVRTEFAKRIRALIESPCAGDVMLHGILQASFPSLRHKLVTAIVDNPVELQSYLVHLDYSTTVTDDRHFIVHFPHFGPDAEHIYSVLAEREGKEQNGVVRWKVDVRFLHTVDSEMPGRPYRGLRRA